MPTADRGAATVLCTSTRSSSRPTSPRKPRPDDREQHREALPRRRWRPGARCMPGVAVAASASRASTARDRGGDEQDRVPRMGGDGHEHGSGGEGGGRRNADVVQSRRGDEVEQTGAASPARNEVDPVGQRSRDTSARSTPTPMTAARATQAAHGPSRPGSTAPARPLKRGAASRMGRGDREAGAEASAAVALAYVARGATVRADRTADGTRARRARCGAGSVMASAPRAPRWFPIRATRRGARGRRPAAGARRPTPRSRAAPRRRSSGSKPCRRR